MRRFLAISSAVALLLTVLPVAQANSTQSQVAKSTHKTSQNGKEFADRLTKLEKNEIKNQAKN